jgi:adenosine deaminase
LSQVYPVRQPYAFYQSMPKVDLHRHLEGSLRLRTLVEVGHSHGLNLPGTGKLRELVSIGEEETFTFANFLSKFETLRLFYRSPEIIARLAREAVADAAADKVRYLELRFTPAALGRAENFPMGEVIDWVIEGVRQAERENPIQVGLIVSVNRHEPVKLAEQVAMLAADRRGMGIMGFDLAGNEAHFPALPFAGVFSEAKQAGLHITAHAGEWGTAQNVADAIRELHVERIGHGVRVLEDPAVTALAREMNTTFEVCITSNYQSGVIASQEAHPLPRMLAHGLNVTINTDDPSISQIRLTDEYRRACEEMGLTVPMLQERVLAAAQAAFLPDEKRQTLARMLMKEFRKV